jgi:gentisate 1,2-dioxygenase
MTAIDYPKYRALSGYQSIPCGPGEEPRAVLLHRAAHRFLAWAPAEGNITPSWTWVSTPDLWAGMFVVPAGGWFDPGDHPSPEPYYILQGTLHLSNPDTADVVELRAGDASNIPAWSNHHGFNVGDDDCLIAWWVPGEMHTDLFKQKIEDGTLDEIGWYERRPVVLNGDHDRNEGFPSRLDQLRSWPGEPRSDVDMMKLDRAGWLHLITGDEPRQAYLTSLFYCDEQIRAGEMRLPARRDTKPESIPFEKVICVTAGTLVTCSTGTTDVLRAEPGDVVYVPADIEHSFMSVGPAGVTAVFGMARAAGARTRLLQEAPA